MCGDDGISLRVGCHMTTSATSAAGNAPAGGRFLPALVGLVPLLLLPTVVSLKPFWRLVPRALEIVWWSATAYIVAGAFLAYGQRRGRPATFLQVLFVWAAVFMPVVLAVPAFNEGYSRSALLIAPLLALGLLWLAFSIQRWRRVRLLAVTGLAVLAIGAQVGLGTGLIARPKPEASVKRSHVDSALYELQVTSYRHIVPEPFTQQGGITRFGPGYLLATGDGDLFVFERPAGRGRLDLRPLPFKVPLNSDEFTAAMRNLPVSLNWFRVADVLAQDTARGIRLLAVHHYWKSQDQCFVVRVSAMEGAAAQYLDGSLQWKTLFDTSPCLKVVQEGREPYFVGLENGGRLALLGERELLLSVGDHSINGVDTKEIVAQDPDMFYGKVVHIDLDTGVGRVVSLGHRNPQGLTVDSTGRIWSTEHGPQGGDELNLVEEGGNYGWPIATYGVDYGTHVWPLTEVPGSHDRPGVTQPFHTWTPAIGISNLHEVDSPSFEYWRGDLLIGSLTDRSLWRVRIRDQRVVVAEPIPIGERVRDIVPGHRGEFVLWTDAESIMFVEPLQQTQISRVQELLRSCAACHTRQDNQESASGPDLRGVVGRRVASVEGFQYSVAMRAAGGVWSRERLDAFLRNPTAAIPGTAMLLGGVPDAELRRQLIDHLAAPPDDPGGGSGDDGS